MLNKVINDANGYEIASDEPPVVRLRGCLHVSPLEPTVAINISAPRICMEAGLCPCSSETFRFVSDGLSHCRVGNQALTTELGFEHSPNCCAGPWRGVSFHPHKRLVIEAREWCSWGVRVSQGRPHCRESSRELQRPRARPQVGFQMPGP